MKDKLVTLIGGGGFIGRYVAQDLLRAKARVRIAQRKPGKAFFLKPLGGLGQTQFIAADVTDPETLARAIAGSDAVVNFAGTWSAFDAIQARGAANVAQAAAAAGVEALVHISAVGADPESPSAYGRSKAQGEANVRAAFPKATILRPTVVFGREDQFINRFAGMMGLPVVPILRGETKMQPVYVADVAAAVVAALADPGAHGGKTYELGGPDVMTLGELNRWIARSIGRHPLFIDLPEGLGSFLSLLPGGPITRDQWRMLHRDAVVSPEAKGLKALGVTATPLGAIAPSWLVRFRRHGRFGTVGQAA